MVTTREGKRQGCDSGVSELASGLSGVSFCLLGQLLSQRSNTGHSPSQHVPLSLPHLMSFQDLEEGLAQNRCSPNVLSDTKFVSHWKTSDCYCWGEWARGMQDPSNAQCQSGLGWGREAQHGDTHLSHPHKLHLLGCWASKRPMDSSAPRTPRGLHLAG